jgi:hypothetical protein
MSRIAHRVTGWAVLVALALTGTAAASPSDIYVDCQDGRLDQRYSSTDLRRALANMPADLDEYTNCREIIRSAQHGVRGPGGSGPGGGQAGGYGPIGMGDGGLPVGADKRQVDPLGFAETDERREVEQARERAGGLPSRLTSEVVSAASGVAPERTSGAAVPTPLLVLLVLVGAGIAALGASRVRDLVLRRTS